MDKVDKIIICGAFVFILALFGLWAASIVYKSSCIEKGMEDKYTASDIQAICKF